MSTQKSITERETEQIERAKQSGRTAVVFVHGLWLLPYSWDRWAALFEADDFVALTLGWPDDPDTVHDANANPQVFAGKSIGEVADTTPRSSPDSTDHRWSSAIPSAG